MDQQEPFEKLWVVSSLLGSLGVVTRGGLSSRVGLTRSVRGSFEFPFHGIGERVFD